jgi:hypothetical protein
VDTRVGTTLKEESCKGPMLACPDDDKAFILQMDKVSVLHIVSQEDREGNWLHLEGTKLLNRVEKGCWCIALVHLSL